VRAQRLPHLLLVGVLLLSFAVPAALASEGREAAVSLTADSLTKEAKPGEPAEYTITVSNDGSDDITVSLSTQEGQGCQGYNSAIEQITGTIAASSSEDVTLTVNVTQGAADECETIVRATAQVAPPGTPGAPVQEELTVTTTLGDGGGSGAFQVSLTSDQPTIQYESGESITFTVDVENGGQSQENIQLELDSESVCRSSELSGTLDPEQVNVAAGDTETVTMTVNLQRGSQTDAGDHCFIVRAIVSNDPNPEKAQDNISLTIQIPETHNCDAHLEYADGSSIPGVISMNPGEVESFRVEFDNTGNAGWTVNFGTSGSPASWIDVVGASSQNLVDTANFLFDVRPDASVAAGDSISIRAFGKDGSLIKCDDYVTIQIGQNHAGSMSLSQSRINGIEPGTEQSVNVIIQNDGNGRDIFEISGTAVFTDGSGVASGWQVGFSNSSITLESHLAGSGDSGAVQMTVTAPLSAMANRAIDVNIALVSSGQSELSGEVTLDVSVAEMYGFGVELAANDSTGRTDQTIKFPVVLTNTGNIADIYALAACDGANPLSCDNPPWSSRFSNEGGDQITQIQIEPGASASFYLDISIQSQLEGVNKRIDMRVTSMGDPQLVVLETITARVSNFHYSMAIGLMEPGDDADVLELILPPTGNTSIDFWIENVGNSSFSDSAIIKVTGLEDSVVRRILFNGSEIDGPIQMPRDERVLITVEFEVAETAENGAAGTIHITAASIRNPTETNEISTLFTIRTVHDLAVEMVGGETTVDTVYPRSASFMIRVTNLGNIEEEVELYASEGLRGWTVDVELESFTLAVGESKEIKIVAKPPAALLQEDHFQFTVVTRPAGQASAAQPIDLIAVAAPPSGIFQSLGFSDEQQMYVSWGVFGIIGLVILSLLVRSRRDAKYIRHTLENESDEL
jgi:uncharacterized membrane protein